MEPLWFSMSGRHHREKPTRALFFFFFFVINDIKTSISVVIVSIITVIYISHSRMLVLTPEDEHKGSQG